MRHSSTRRDGPAALHLAVICLLLSALLIQNAHASTPQFKNLNATATFRFDDDTNANAPGLRATRRLAKAADWEPWPSSRINNIEIVHNLCDDEWITAVERAARDWSDRSKSVGIRVTQAKCNRRVNDDLTYIPFKIHLVYGTCGSDCCGKANVEYAWRGSFDITNYQALVRLDPDCFDGSGSFYDLGRQYLACHEIGHALGLGHNNDKDSCLSSYTGDNYGPGRDDIRILDEKLYPDAAASGSVGRPQPQPQTWQRPQPQPQPRPVPRPVPRPDIFSNERDSSRLSTIRGGDCATKECGRCEGDCDSDSQCQDGLKCFFRSDSSPVPGCSGSGVPADDYCYDPRSSSVPGVSRPLPTRPPPPPPTRRPTTRPRPAPTPNFSTSTLMRVSGRNCAQGQCSKCQGDCDSDDECQRGLKCFFRTKKNPWEPVPGCQGWGEKGRDYCYNPNDYFIFQQGRESRGELGSF